MSEFKSVQIHFVKDRNECVPGQVTFEEPEDIEVDDTCIQVFVEEKTTYLYPLHQVARLKAVRN